MTFSNKFFLFIVMVIAAVLTLSSAMYGQWIPQYSGVTVDLRDVIFLNSSTAIVVGDSGIMLKTTDAGQTWVQKLQVPGVQWNAVAFADARKGMVVGTGESFALTTDGGETWTVSSLGGSADFTAVSFMGETSIYIGDNNGRILFSLDSGTTWQDTSFSTTPVQDIYFYPGAYIHHTGYIVDYYYIYETHDSGNSWTSYFLPTATWGNGWAVDMSPDARVTYVVGTSGHFADMPFFMHKAPTDSAWQITLLTDFVSIGSLMDMDISVPDSQVAFVSTYPGYIFNTRDGGATWSVNFYDSLHHFYAIDFYDTERGLVVGNSGTILFTNNGGITRIGREPESRPKSFQLFQNYPNPFNSTTVITYQLPSAARVELTVYNLLGQRVRILFQGAQPSGQHQFYWDGKDDQGRELPSGIYFYQLKASHSRGGVVQTHRMMLLR